MQSRALEILVGFFVCLGVAAIFVLTFRVASNDNVGGGGSYTVTADFNNIGSLAPGASVKLAGVRIGSVTGITIDPTTFQAVVAMQISNAHKDIPTDSAAKILTAGLLGEQYVGIDPGGMETVLKNGSHIQFTQSAFILENVIGQFLTGMVQKNGHSSSSSAAAPASAPAPSP
ncbi:MAG TPA: outer membrane lipid asymmetry maintenance protein MlaD [Nevskiaceae bacterium]|nr:outer membrane lipid asymmetry maintenance protein MlaD [Nevskiaceae bacterium]